jgi:hypothetical protein
MEPNTGWDTVRRYSQQTNAFGDPVKPQPCRCWGCRIEARMRRAEAQSNVLWWSVTVAWLVVAYLLWSRF